MSHIVTDLKAFLDASPTSWHAVKEASSRLALRDFQPLYAEERWHLEPGKKYFVARGGALCAFILPEAPAESAFIMAAHTDSPALKLKPSPVFQKENMTQLGVEVYGAPLLSSWLNRDLALAGRVVVTASSKEVQERLVYLDDALVCIPQLAIHLDREVNEKGLLLNKQDHLAPIMGLNGPEGKDALERLLRRHLAFQTLLAFELFLVPHEPARLVGMNQEMLASWRLDNLASMHASLCALGLQEKPSRALQMAFFWDHEEIGSRSKEGAGSPFLQETLSRIAQCLGLDAEALLMLKAQSLCVSLDMAHALHPNYVGKHEPNHTPLLGKGIALKYNADQKYASNATSSAPIVQACQELNLAYQPYVCRSDTPCGSTVGPLIAQSTGIDTVDIGCPQLSMHSTRELMATQDYIDLVTLLHHLMQTR